jgi:hypothetical protein
MEIKKGEACLARQYARHGVKRKDLVHLAHGEDDLYISARESEKGRES